MQSAVSVRRGATLNKLYIVHLDLTTFHIPFNVLKIYETFLHTFSTSKNVFVYYCMNLVFSHNSLLPKCFPFFQIIQCRHRGQLQPRLADILCRLEADEILQELNILLHFPQDLLVLT